MALAPTPFVFLGIVALLASAITVSRSVDPRVGGLLSCVLWFVWGLNAFRIVEYTDSGTQIIHNWDVLAFVGFGLAVLFLVDWIKVLFDQAGEDLGKYARI